MAASSQVDSHNTMWPFPFLEEEWHHTPPSVQHSVMALQPQLVDLPQQVDQRQKQVELLQGRLDNTSQPSSKPPSSDSPFTKPQRAKHRNSSGKRGAKQGPPGSGPTLLEPTEVQHVYPAPCACGHGALAPPTLYHTHQVIELPPIDMQITPFLLPQAPCGGCGQIIKAEVPSPDATGYGPHVSGRIGERSGMHGTSRRLMQHCCHAVLHLPISLGGLSKKSSTRAPGPSYPPMKPEPNWLATPPWAPLMPPRSMANTPYRGSGP